MEQDGGRLLAYGRYGCVFTSSLHCKNKPPAIEDKHLPTITKLIEQDYAEIEFKMASIVRKIPLWKQYFAVSESICEPAKKQTESDLKKCPVVKGEPLSNFRVLSMAYRGVPIDSFRMNVKTFDPIAFISHFLEAGALLTLFGVVHRDIHRGNILIDTFGVPRIIDFNLAVYAKDDVAEDMFLHSHTLQVSQESPDATLVNATAHGYDGRRVIDSLLSKKEILKKIQSLLGVSTQYMRQRLNHFYQHSDSVKSGDSAAWFRSYWTKIDSWSVGVNIVFQIIKWSISPAFSLGPQQKKLFDVLRKMCEVSPLDRIDCVQALHLWNPSHLILQRYGKEWLAKVSTTV